MYTRVTAGLRKAGRRRLLAVARRLAPRMGEQLVADLFVALDAQTVVVPGTDAAERVLPRLAASLHTALEDRRRQRRDLQELLRHAVRAKRRSEHEGHSFCVNRK